MNTLTEHGFLVIADISGYTSYLARVELEHANEILADLLAAVVDKFKTALTISKLEGDAVFANVKDADMPGSERILEIIENTYFAFRNRRDMCVRRTTCTCRACSSISSLELKFFVHHGDYMVQNISGIRELVGTDVNLVHRLTKNHLAEAAGWQAYTMFTEKALGFFKLSPEEFHVQAESYEHLGDVRTFSRDNHPRFDEMLAATHVVIPPEEADYRVEFNFNAPPHLVWDWMMDVDRRSQAMGANGSWSVVSRPGGRTGVGARNHCAHGRGTTEEVIQDWRPFEYSTSMNVDGKARYQSMYIFTPFDDGRCTHVEIRMKIFEPGPLWLTRLMVRAQFSIEQPYLHWLEAIKPLVEKSPEFQSPPEPTISHS